MTIAELGALGEFLGFIGIMLTLAYLGYQTHQNTRSIQAANTFAILHETNVTNMQLAQDADLRELFLAAMNDPDVIDSEDDSFRFQLAFRSYVNVFQAAHAVRDSVPPTYWQVLVRSNELLSRTPGGKAFYDGNRHLFDAEFLSFIDDLEGKATQMRGMAVD